jgi:predicted alpha/beta hydrolase
MPNAPNGGRFSREAMDDATTAARIAPRSATIPTRDGIDLSGLVYEPSGEARFDLLALPGIGVPQRMFRHLAGWLRERGVRVTTVDYRGMGTSPRDSRALSSASLTTWAKEDAVSALRHAERLANGGPVVLLGHSFGGQVLGFSEEFRRVCAAILVGSQFGQARYWDGLGRLKIAAYWHVVLPIASALSATIPGWLGLREALPSGVGREWARWGRSRDWLLTHVPGAAARYATFDRPLRAYAMLDDPIAPPRAVSALLERFRDTRVERIDLAPGDLGLSRLGHVGLFRPGPTERVWRELLAFAESCLETPRARAP